MSIRIRTLLSGAFLLASCIGVLGTMSSGPSPELCVTRTGEDGMPRITAIDAQGKNLFAIPGIDSTWSFSEGLVGVKDHVSGSWGFVDSAGEWKIPPTYDSVSHFSEGLAPVKTGDKWGFIDSSGAEKLPPTFAHVGCLAAIPCGFSEGFAAVRTEAPKRKSERRCGYIDNSGQVVIPEQFSGCGMFSDGFAPVMVMKKREKLYGYIDKTGAFVIEPRFARAGLFGDGLAAVLEGENDTDFGYIDKKGEMKLEPRFSFAHPFSDGRALACESEKTCGIIDTSGSWLVEPNWALTIPAGNSSLMFVYDDKHQPSTVVDRSGATIWTTAGGQEGGG